MARRVPFFSFLENVRFLHYYGEDSIIKTFAQWPSVYTENRPFEGHKIIESWAHLSPSAIRARAPCRGGSFGEGGVVATDRSVRLVVRSVSQACKATVVSEGLAVAHADLLCFDCWEFCVRCVPNDLPNAGS